MRIGDSGWHYSKRAGLNTVITEGSGNTPQASEATLAELLV
jgi:hypothetical protein